jgi:hypothetical protein
MASDDRRQMMEHGVQRNDRVGIGRSDDENAVAAVVTTTVGEEDPRGVEGGFQRLVEHGAHSRTDVIVPGWVTEGGDVDGEHHAVVGPQVIRLLRGRAE